jgi:8-oxo-dGTP pyrophosphatase MutT (NUDIX family)
LKTKDDGARPLATAIDLIQDISAISSPVEGYLRRYRHRIKTRLSDGTRTDVFVADFVDRASHQRDAVGVILFARAPSIEATRVLLRRQLRYAAYIALGTPLVAEVVAGLIERPETPEQTAVRELWEEVGIHVPADVPKALGKPFFILPGLLPELMFPVAVELTNEVLESAQDALPSGDGSPFEQGAEHVIMQLCIRGAREDIDVADSKTELILRRLEQALREGSL